ncbi:DUF4062 domain-containing protein [Candidatus Uabimicrobium amorphum]|uniref:DUF4062 domain-containing protein n=1 Tax=Uabimicrobium amorphum TaxID=2596890 RepID=A0A5S9F110_UABAM|nr:DUF4062 domain-containing protein [Candidatus Uabimicrobium amorphum]BBM82117.1 hypothetical protein UABAM_00460 [Candidatus Uabimicrobium amorphum]
MYTWKNVKIFISSTFKDLELERDQLAKVFEKLQQRFFARKIAIIPYDLRWQQKHDEQNLVRWCLDKIDQCQYFVGILGHRYGWRPQKNYQGQENAAQYSITEMEIRHSCQVINTNNRFYFLDDRHKSPQEVNETQQDLDSLQNLVTFLQQSNEKTFRYDDSSVILEKVYSELEQRIDRDYPELLEVQTSSLHSMREEIILEKIKGFVGREQYLEQIREFCRQSSATNYLCVCAVAGTGKSSLAAYFIDTQRKENIVLWHYMSMGGNTGEINTIYESIAEQLQQKELLEIDDTQDLKEQIVQTLEKTKEKIIIVFDGLDEMQGKALELNWLFRNLPPNIRVIMTTRPVAPWEKIQKLANLQVLELPPLDATEIELLLDNYQTTRDLQLTTEERALLTQRAQGSPLFLKVALDQMLNSGVAVGQLAESVNQLFHQALERLEDEYGKGLVERYLGTIAASRSGISENEIAEILTFGQEVRINDDLVLVLQKSLENFLIQRNFLVNFFHPEFERTVKMRLGKGKIREYHQLLAQYLSDKGFDYDRTQFELPYQLQWGEMYHELLDLLTNPQFLQKKSAMIDNLFEDFARSLTESAVPIPHDLEIQNSLQITVDKSILEDLRQILQLRHGFLRKYPQTLFQCVWNLGYWTESDSCIHRFVEAWREQCAPQTWLKSLKPPANLLHSPLQKVLQGHKSRTTDVIFSDDDKQVISCGGIYDFRVRVWDLYTGECLHILRGHGTPIESARHIKEGKQILSVSRSGRIVIWDAQTGETLQIIETEEAKSKVKVAKMDISADEKIVALSSSNENSIRLWHMDSWQMWKVLSGHEDWVKDVAFHPTKTILASASKDYTVRIWDYELEKELYSFRHDAEVWSVVFHPGGEKVISSSRDKTVRVWNIVSGECEKILTGHTGGGVNAVNISYDGKWIASGGEDRTVRIWEEETGKCVRVFKGHQELLKGVAFSRKGDKVASVSKDKTVMVWCLNTKPIDTEQNEHKNKIFQVVYDKGKIFSASPEEVRVWQEDGTLLHSLVGPPGQTTLLNVARNKLVTSGNDRKIWLWTDFTKEPQILSHHKSGVLNVQFDATQQYFLSASRDKTICLWDATNEENITPTTTFRGHSDWVQKAIFHPNVPQIASCSKDKTIKIWNKDSGECIHTLEGHKDWIRDIAYSSDGKYLASVASDKKVHLWCATTGELRKTFLGHKSQVREVTFRKNDTQLFTQAFSATIVFDVESGETLYRYPGFTALEMINDQDEYFVFGSDYYTTVVARQTQSEIAWWPFATDFVFIGNSGVISGGRGSGYLPVIQLVTSTDTLKN